MSNEINYLEVFAYNPIENKCEQRTLTLEEIAVFEQEQLKAIVLELESNYETISKYKLKDHRSEKERLFYLFFNTNDLTLTIKKGRHSKLTGNLTNIKGNITNNNGFCNGELYGDVSRIEGNIERINGCLSDDIFGDASGADGNISNHKGDLHLFQNNKKKLKLPIVTNIESNCDNNLLNVVAQEFYNSIENVFYLSWFSIGKRAIIFSMVCSFLILGSIIQLIIKSFRWSISSLAIWIWKKISNKRKKETKVSKEEKR